MIKHLEIDLGVDKDDKRVFQKVTADGRDLLALGIRRMSLHYDAMGIGPLGHAILSVEYLVKHSTVNGAGKLEEVEVDG